MSKDKINILFVLPDFDTGGSEKLVFDIIRHIDKSKFSPVLCVFFSGVYEEEFLELGVPFYTVHEKGQRRSKVQVVKFLNKIMHKHSIQIVNTHHTSTLLQGLLSYKLFNRSVVIHTEHTRLDHDPNIPHKIIKIQKIFLKFVNTTLGISQGVCDYFKSELGVPKSKIVKILNGVDIERFQIEENEKIRLIAKYRKEIGINEDDIVVGMCANFRKQKNHPNLINACKILVDEGVINFKVILCGTGPEFENIKKMTCDLGLETQVQFLGPRLDIPELMNMFDIYCLPSFFEGLPFSILEAMAAGKPIVATKVLGNTEVVFHEETGLLVDDDDPKDLAKALQKLINDKALREDLGGKAKNYVQELSFEQMMRNYEALFLGSVKK